MIALHRAYMPDGSAVYGRMTVGGQTMYTVECPWRGNEPGVSCIPEGVYTCRPRRYNRGGYDAIEVTGVPGRSMILFHRGNWVTDLRGCIAPGWTLGVVDGRIGVADSTGAFAHLMEHFGGKTFTLSVTSMRGGVYVPPMPVWTPISPNRVIDPT